MKSFIEEFKTFAVKGNVVDLAVAVVIGTAFGKIVSSLVDNIIMPIVGILLGGVSFSSMQFMVGSAAVTYGVFVQSVVDFLIVAFVIFVVVKMINKASRLGEEDTPESEGKPAEPPEDVKLLREIRDSLRTR